MSSVTPRAAPGIKQFPLSFGLVGRLRSDPLGFMLEGRERFGDVFRYRIGPFPVYQVSHPDGVRHVLVDAQKNYTRGRYYHRLVAVAGRGLVTTDGEEWRRLRRIAQPAFHRKRIDALAEVMTAATVPTLRRWAEAAKSGETLDVAQEFTTLTLRIVGLTLFGVDLTGEAARVGRALAETFVYVEHRLSHLLSLPPSFPTPRNLRLRRALAVFDDLIYGILARRRSEGREGQDLLGLLLSARDEETGQGLSDRELRDQMLTFIAAGHETTAVALTWTFYLLDRNPEAAERLRQKVAVTLDGRTPTADDLPRLGCVRRAIEESLRIYPPVYAVARQAVAEDEISGYRIPKGATIVLSPYVTHRHPDVWPDPERFDPDRFLPEQAADRPRLAWFPFLAGPHQCIGQEFALMEATLITSMLIQRFRWRLAAGATVEPKALLSLRPRDGMPMRIEAV